MIRDQINWDGKTETQAEMLVRYKETLYENCDRDTHRSTRIGYKASVRRRGIAAMAELKAGDPFGMDPAALAKIDWPLALKRIMHDMRTDFIYAPHLHFICAKAGGELAAGLVSELKAGAFSPGVPITVEVPKPFRIRVAAKTKRLGPNFSRPGIFFCQKTGCCIKHSPTKLRRSSKRTPTMIDPSATSSRQPETPPMFLPTRTCWSALQKRLAELSKNEALQYILKVDVANFFGSLN